MTPTEAMQLYQDQVLKLERIIALAKSKKAVLWSEYLANCATYRAENGPNALYKAEKNAIRLDKESKLQELREEKQRIRDEKALLLAEKQRLRDIKNQRRLKILAEKYVDKHYMGDNKYETLTGFIPAGHTERISRVDAIQYVIDKGLVI